MSKPINVTIQEKTHQIPKKTTLLDLSKQAEGPYPFILAQVDNKLLELFNTVTEDCEIRFLDIRDPNGFRAYQRSAAFLMICAAKEILGKKTRIVIEHSINKNYYCKIAEKGVTISKDLVASIEARMRELVKEDLPFEKVTIPLDEGIRLARKFGLHDKERNLHYRRSSYVNFYKLGQFYDYFYGVMVPSTGYLTAFKLKCKGDGLILQFPSGYNPEESLPEIKSYKKISKIFQEASDWTGILKIDTVGSLNDVICDGGLGDIVRVSEALHEKKLAQIADMIFQEGKTIVLIAGPSSSGKTTFAGRLAVQLRVNGLRPTLISLDDYFVNRKLTPLDELGRPDYECLESIDLKQINEDLANLLEGRPVALPTFNFITGQREYNGRSHKLMSGDVLLIEGLHGLNEKLTEAIPKNRKFKIFISALTQLNMDDHNRIPTTDTRMIRRMVRDNRFRGIDAVKTITMWPQVMQGESRHIFPFQEDADVFFNSALVYEMCVLKQFAEPLLLKIDRSMAQYVEAQRLAKFLDSFLGISSEEVPANSILREFIGGSCFNR